MTTFVPRPPYSDAELKKLYPENLELRQVQVFLRHGERTPVSPRFQNAGLRPYWPYCNVARRLTSALMTSKDGSQWENLQWKRKLESVAADDSPKLATGPDGNADNFCQYAELTDKGRETALALGQRLRKLYVDQVGFMPSQISSSNGIYLRATPLSRALESVQQAFVGLYPSSARSTDFPPPDIVVRTVHDEILYPNDYHCKRFTEFNDAYARRAASRWNTSNEMGHVNKKIGKWMPVASPRVAVDSSPRLSGIMDTINSTLAHGPLTRLPAEFYDPEARRIIEKIGMEEWYAGYHESREYRTVAIGALVGDVVERMLDSTTQASKSSPNTTGKAPIKIALSGCHDTTIAGMLSGFGAFNNEPWPPFTSHLAIELFEKKGEPASSFTSPKAAPSSSTSSQSWLSRIFSSSSPSPLSTQPSVSPNRLPLSSQPPATISALSTHYVRLRYNDRVMTIPGCRKTGNHFEGDESLCTLTAFKAIADDFTPRSWREACSANLGTDCVLPEGREEWGGYAAGEGPGGRY